MPLSEVKSAAVFINAGEPQAAEAAEAVRKFFGAARIPVMILSPKQEELNFALYMKPEFRCPEGKAREEDLFISLASDRECFAAEFESACSPARFKVGRLDYKRMVPFDLTVYPEKDGESGQAAIFEVMKEYLLKIR